MDTGPSLIPRSRKALYVAIIILAPLICISLCGEFAVRSFRKQEVDTERLRADLKANSIAAIVENSDDAVLGIELIPGKVCEFKNATVTISPEGYRCSSHTGTNPPPAVRVAVLGDSTAFGWGLEYEASYPEVFRSRMETLSGKAIELRNYAVPAYNSKQESRLFTHRVLRSYSPDLVILGYDHNDPEPALNPLLGALPPEYGDNPFHSMLWKYVLRKGRQRWTRLQSFGLNRHTFVKNMVGRFIVGGPLYDRHLQALKQIGDEARKRAIPVVAVVHNPFVVFDPQYARNPDYALLSQRICTNLSGLGFHVLDLTPRYQEKMKAEGVPNLTGSWLSPQDCHPNAVGHEFIAECLVQSFTNTPGLKHVFFQGTSHL
jgi:lysophospholipase L1-like esterase